MQGDADAIPDLPPRCLPRRELLRRAGAGFGLLGLAGLLDDEIVAGMPAPLADAPLAPRPSHFPARARSVIWLFINGGPSHVDTFDHKPALARHVGTEKNSRGSTRTRASSRARSVG